MEEDVESKLTERVPNEDVMERIVEGRYLIQRRHKWMGNMFRNNPYMVRVIESPRTIKQVTKNRFLIQEPIVKNVFSRY